MQTAKPEHDLGFAKIILLQDDLAEVQVHEGIEMDEDMVEQYHDFLLTHMQPPFSLLINKVHSYTYTFNAQRRLACLDEIHAMAVVAYTHISRETTRQLATLPRENTWNLEIFEHREQALNWLQQQSTGASQ